MKLKIRNKFYVGHPKVSAPHEQDQVNDPTIVARPQRWTRATEADAIAHAESILADHPQQDHCVIVRIVKVVRRKRAPIVVESV